MNKKWIASLASVCLLASSCFTAAMAEGMKPAEHPVVRRTDAWLNANGDAPHGLRRWRRMRGRTGTLVTGHCVVAVGGPAGVPPPREPCGRWWL